MSTTPDTAALQQQKVTEFMRLLPLTLEIAGLPRTEYNHTHNNEDQMDVRATTIKLAFKVARRLIKDIAK